ncbi:hypothetical protein RHJ80_06085 [Thermosynechococcus sp. QS41]|nr:hypothetical protein RHJ80_06085 [Thermosynechococcus sp. QS41]
MTRIQHVLAQRPTTEANQIQILHHNHISPVAKLVGNLEVTVPPGAGNLFMQLRHLPLNLLPVG